jgi:hypothetical protein
MELKDFVKESIVQVSKGIDEANKDLDELDAMVNPMYVTMNSDSAQSYGRTSTRDSGYSDADSRVIQKVDFDIAVTIEKGEEASAGAKISIASFALGADAKTDSNNKSQSRIKFSLPVVFPVKKNNC